MTHPLTPQPLSPEQLADLIERVRTKAIPRPRRCRPAMTLSRVVARLAELDGSTIAVAADAVCALGLRINAGAVFAARKSQPRRLVVTHPPRNVRHETRVEVSGNGQRHRWTCTCGAGGCWRELDVRVASGAWTHMRRLSLRGSA